MGPFPFTVTAHSTAMSISNLFPNLVPCDSEIYFYPALNQRESICCQSGCHHVKCCVGEELNAPQPRSDQQNKRVHWLCPLLTPTVPLGLRGKGHEKAKRGFILAKNEASGDIQGERRVTHCVFKHRKYQQLYSLKTEHTYDRFTNSVLLFKGTNTRQKRNERLSVT